jgi:hypothetical protein
MAMSAGLPFSRREHRTDVELDTKAAALADHVTPADVQRQFAQALPSKVGKTKVFDLTSVLPPSKAAASADHVTSVNVKRQFAAALPCKVRKIRLRQSDLEKAEGKAKRDVVRGKTARVKAAASLRKNLLCPRQQRKKLEPIQKLRQLKHYEGKKRRASVEFKTAAACRRRRLTFVSAADVEETPALKKKESSTCGRRRFE